jgi:hypothetical protein
MTKPHTQQEAFDHLLGVLDLIPPKSLYMHTYFNDDKEFCIEHYEGSCGTVGCHLGWAMKLDPWFEKHGWNGDPFAPNLKMANYNLSFEGMWSRYFEITPKELNILFFPEKSRDLEEQRRVVIELMRSYHLKVPNG